MEEQTPLAAGEQVGVACRTGSAKGSPCSVAPYMIASNMAATLLTHPAPQGPHL